MDDMPVSIHYTTETQLLRALKTTFSRKDGPTEQDIINRMSKVDVLVLEEVGMAKDSEYNLTALQEIIDARHRSKRTNHLRESHQGPALLPTSRPSWPRTG